MTNVRKILHFELTEYWKEDVILMNFFSMAEPENDKMTTSCAASDENIIEMTTPVKMP